MDAMSSGDEYDDKMTVLEDICGGSQSHPRIYRKDARYKIRDCIK